MLSKAPGLADPPGQMCRAAGPRVGVPGAALISQRPGPLRRTGSDGIRADKAPLPATPSPRRHRLQALRSTWEAGLPNPSCAFVRKSLVSGLGEGVLGGVIMCVG